MKSNLNERRKRTMDKFDGRSEFRHTGDVIPVDLIEETSEENSHKVVSLLKEALEILEREK